MVYKKHFRIIRQSFIERRSMEPEKEELTIPWLEVMKEKKDTPPDPDYVTMLEELEYK